jgi:hypothetical protein
MSKRVPQSRDELEAHLREQVAFLESSAAAFDAGFDGEAKRLAVAIRVLVHDTSSSRSLLTQLGRKNTLFADTAAPLNSKNLLPEASLVGISMGPAGVRYYAPLGDHPCGERRVPFERWWDGPVLRDEQRALLTRRDLVLTAANQAGGAHVDPGLDGAYARVSRGDTMAFVVGNGHTERLLLGVELASIRQIAYEVLKTLDPGH